MNFLNLFPCSFTCPDVDVDSYSHKKQIFYKQIIQFLIEQIITMYKQIIQFF